MKVLLEIAYDGSAYHGWQVQKGSGLPTVQGTLQNVLRKLTGEDTELTGCSRTDAGVHALRYFCTAEADRISIPAASIPYAANSLLPDDISVLSAKVCSDNFHPRYDCRYKTYMYRFDTFTQRNPFFSKRTLHLFRSLDIPLMNKAAEHFKGTFDFTAFSSAQCDVTDKVRTVTDCYIVEDPDNKNLYELHIRGNGFLYNMVRIIAGTLVYVSDGKIKEEDIPSVIQSRDRKKAGMTAPAYGLYLEDVEY